MGGLLATLANRALGRLIGVRLGRFLHHSGCGKEQMMDSLTAFGLLAVTAMLVFYALEDRKAVYVLCFAGACALGSIYGFLQGAWPFGIAEAIWSVVAIRRWRLRRLSSSSN